MVRSRWRGKSPSPGPWGPVQKGRGKPPLVLVAIQGAKPLARCAGEPVRVSQVPFLYYKNTSGYTLTLLTYHNIGGFASFVQSEPRTPPTFPRSEPQTAALSPLQRCVHFAAKRHDAEPSALGLFPGFDPEPATTGPRPCCAQPGVCAPFLRACASQLGGALPSQSHPYQGSGHSRAP